MRFARMVRTITPMTISAKNIALRSNHIMPRVYRQITAVAVFFVHQLIMTSYQQENAILYAYGSIFLAR